MSKGFGQSVDELERQLRAQPAPRLGPGETWSHRLEALIKLLDERFYEAERGRRESPPGASGFTSGGGVVTTGQEPSIAQLRADIATLLERQDVRFGVQGDRLRSAIDELAAWRARG